MTSVARTTSGTQTCSVSVSPRAALRLNLLETHQRSVSSSACDCNLDGTERPSCDPETGECMCRVGVTGMFCDECAPGYDPEFPACRECHPCSAMWAEDVTDVQRASQVLKKLVPNIPNLARPADNRLLQRVLDLQSSLDGLKNLTALSPLVLEEVEELYQAIRLVHV